jgi:hypothetical protein
MFGGEGPPDEGAKPSKLTLREAARRTWLPASFRHTASAASWPRRTPIDGHEPRWAQRSHYLPNSSGARGGSLIVPARLEVQRRQRLWDGDTMIVIKDGVEEVIRLSGIDCLESFINAFSAQSSILPKKPRVPLC